jgi:putative DNA primase/helicase
MPIGDLLAKLEGVRKSGSGWVAKCPAHDDSHQSLSIAEQESRKGSGRVIVLYCHVGCDAARVCSELGIKESDLFIPAPGLPAQKSVITATYDYCDETGVIVDAPEDIQSNLRVVKKGQPYVREGLVYQSVRLEPGRDGHKKDFFQRRPAEGGRWVNNLKGVSGRWPFLLPELAASMVTIAGVQAPIVFIVEGEKDVLTLRGKGLIATTSAGGAGKWPGSRDFNSWFRDRRCVIIEDHDPLNPKTGRRPGQDHANDVARKVSPYAFRVQVLTHKELLGLPETGGDITDWLALGHDTAELLRVCELAGNWSDPGAPPTREPGKKSRRVLDDELLDRWLEGSPPMIFSRGDFWQYDTGLWKIRGEYMVRQEILRVLCAAKDKGEGVEPTAALLSSVYNLAKARRAVEDELLDSNYEYLVCHNGALHIASGKLGPHSPLLYATTGVSYDFDPEAKSPNWDAYIKWLVDVRLGQDTVDFLQDFSGLCATIDVSHEIAVWLLGARRCGKSTFIAGLTAAFPINERSCELGLRSIERSQFALVQLPGKTLATATEQPADFIRSLDILNSIISGEPITVERKYHDAYTFAPTAKLLWSMDKMPRVSHAGSGLFERVQVIDFGREIPAAERRPELKEGIKSEGAAILNWALVGLKRLTDRKRFVIPAKVQQSNQAFQEVNDVTALFVADCLEMGGEDYRVRGGDLYKAYREWCDRNGNKPQSNNSVGLDWVRLGLEKYKSAGHPCWKGARLRSDINSLFADASPGDPDPPEWNLEG